jgi:ABC-type sugar transport system substrate-binding protein
MNQRNKWWLPLAILSAVALAACGSSSKPSSSTPTSSSGVSSATSSLQAEVTKLETRPTTIGITTALKGNVPSGKTIDFVDSCQATCTALFKNLTEGAAVFGWKTKNIDAIAGTPEVVKAAWEEMVADPPDGIVASGGFPHQYFQSEMNVLAAKGVPILTQGDPAPAGHGVLVSLEANRYKLNGIRLAEFVIAKSNGNAHVVVQNLPGQTGIVTMFTTFEEVMKEKCPSCTVYRYNMASTDTNFAGDTASQVEAHPGTNYVVTAYADFAVGLPAALVGAGLSEVKIVTQVQDAPMIQEMGKPNSPMSGIYGYPGPEITWRAIDTFARFFTHQSTAVDQSSPYGEWFITPSNLSPELSSGYFPLVANYQQDYKELWGK